VLRRFSVDFAIFSMVVDMLAVSLGLRLAIVMRPSLSALPFTANFYGPFNIPLVIFPIFSVLWVLVFQLFFVYDGRRNLRIIDELTAITMGCLLASISAAGLLYVTYREISRALFLAFAIIVYLLIVFVRFVYRLYFYLNRVRGDEQRRVLIVGAGPVGQEIAGQVLSYRDLGLKLVGFLDDDTLKRDAADDILGRLADAKSIVTKHQIDDVVLALPRRAYERANQIVTELHDMAVKVWIVPDYFALALNRASVNELAGMPMIDLRAPALTEYERMVKRIFDIVVTCLMLPFALPLMGLIGLWIKLDSPGPVIFKQKRVGENGRLFEMLKFRSMVVNAEDMRHLIERKDAAGHLHQYKSDKDPRITRVGRFIRRTSLDELPQLFNVLKDEMSLVGPRPELPQFVEHYELWQRKRFAVPQGITGWWQVNGRSDKPMYQNTEDDLFYIQHYSIFLDIQILIKTAWTVLRRKGAY
jgi:exopolysaccharide biosynthesis polyprenyl glycosylphosphotransferase